MFSAESSGLAPEVLCFLMRLARCRAQESPAGPAPTMRTSASSCSRWMLTQSFYQSRMMGLREEPRVFLPDLVSCRDDSSVLDHEYHSALWSTGSVQNSFGDYRALPRTKFDRAAF